MYASQESSLYFDSPLSDAVRVTGSVSKIGSICWMRLAFREVAPENLHAAQSIAFCFPDMESIRTVVATLQGALAKFDAEGQEADR